MARVTVEDCMQKVSDKFELVALAAERAKAISSGARLTIEKGNDKFSVVALREMAMDNVEVNLLRESLIKRLQSRTHVETIEEQVTPENIETDIEYLPDTTDLYIDNEFSDFSDDEEIEGIEDGNEKENFD